ncbi:hypothetical protein IPV09_11790, partial [Tessaracoccus sp. SD287]|uniref:hypothetical protein n=1 Tax=Tessaracoccus sp. SD287 TaxID=2782008 RepID=UPI001A976735
TEPPATTQPPTTQPPAGDTITLKGGVVVAVPAGWTVGSQKDDIVQLVHSSNKHVMVLQTFSSGGKSSAALVEQYLQQQGGRMTDVKRNEVAPVKGPEGLDISQGAVSGTQTGSNGSQNIIQNAAISVKSSNQLSVLTTLISLVGAPREQPAKDWNQTSWTMFQTQAAS